MKQAEPMDLNALRSDIKLENEVSLCILEETEEDIITDDMQELRKIPYHMVAPTREWIQSRFIWSEEAILKRAKYKYERLLVEALYHMPHNMLIPLNHVIVVFDQDDESEIDSIMENIENEEPDIDFPDMDSNLLGMKWAYMNSIIISIKSHIQTVMEIILHGDEFNSEMEIGLCTTIIHEMLHQGIEGNPFLPKECIPGGRDDLTEDDIEELCREIYEETHDDYDQDQILRSYSLAQQYATLCDMAAYLHLDDVEIDIRENRLVGWDSEGNNWDDGESLYRFFLLECLYIKNGEVQGIKIEDVDTLQDLIEQGKLYGVDANQE